MFADMFEGIKQLVFPDNCFLCRQYLNNRHQSQLCSACLSAIKRNTPPFCMSCSRHLEHFTVDGICPLCHIQTHGYDRAWGACLYDDNFRKLLYAFKYNGKTALRKTFIPLMLEFIDAYHLNLEQFDIVCPIALHPVRLRERGFNQAAILSEGLCSMRHLPHKPQILVRAKLTDSQTVLDPKQRWTNMDGAFKINSSENIADKSILLVDDLLTTGATANAAATALKGAGAAYVGVLTLAMTETH